MTDAQQRFTRFREKRERGRNNSTLIPDCINSDIIFEYDAARSRASAALKSQTRW